MREIKFRAWDKSKKWMVYDVQNAYDGLWSERNSDEVNDYYGYVSTFQSFTDEESFNFMQYTGLKDKNRVEIYEDDIIEHLDGECSFIGVVQYSPFGWYVKADEDNISFEHFADDISCIADCRVIGNTYEEQKFKEVVEDEARFKRFNQSKKDKI